MKWSAILFAFILSFTIACSSDDGGAPETETKNYLPIAQDNWWVYDYVVTSPVSGSTGRDSTFMGGTTNIEGKQFREWAEVSHLFGFSNEVLVNKTGDETFIKNRDLELGPNDNVEIPAMKLIDDNSSVGTVLDSFELNQELTAITIPETDGITGTITPKIYISANSVHANSYAQLTLNGSQNYTDVYKNESDFKIQVDLIANLVYQNVPFSLTHTWIPEQDYANLSIWFANDIGIARSEIQSGIDEVDNTVDVPLFGEIDLNDFGVSPDDFLNVAELSSVAELTSHEVN